MKIRCASAVLGVALVATAAAAEDIVLSAFAFHHPGYGGNRWTTETYLTNPTSTQARVWVGPALIGRAKLIHPCLAPPSRPFEVPPMSTVVVPGAAFALDLGCPEEFVGGLVLSAEGTIVVGSRMTNDRGTAIAPTAAFVPGFGLELPGVAVPDLPDKDRTYMLPALIWHPNPCGTPLFESAVHFANPNESEVEVTLRTATGAAPRLTVDGLEVDTPYTLKVGARGWRQIALGPPASTLTVCMAPEPLDLFFVVSGPTAVAASVVDRTTQDPRLVLPIPTQP